jgi:hypothetical protein
MFVNMAQTTWRDRKRRAASDGFPAPLHMVLVAYAASACRRGKSHRYLQVPVPHVSIHERNAERAAAVPQLALDSFDDLADSGSDN